MFYPFFFQANIAQLVEQRIRNAQVVGSIPTVGSILRTLKSPYLHENIGFMIGSWSFCLSDAFCDVDPPDDPKTDTPKT